MTAQPEGMADAKHHTRLEQPTEQRSAELHEALSEHIRPMFIKWTHHKRRRHRNQHQYSTRKQVFLNRIGQSNINNNCPSEGGKNNSKIGSCY